MEIEEHPDILDIVYTGIDGSGYTADPTVAALGAIEGEQVLGRFFSKKKGKKFFRIKEIIKTSPERVEPLCSVANVCGGCSFQHANSDYQIKLKEEQYPMDFLHMDMTLEFLMNTKFLPMLIIVLLILKDLMRIHS